MRFIKLTAANGRPIYVNADLILSITDNGNGSDVSFSHSVFRSDWPAAVMYLQTPDEIMALIAAI